MSMRIVKCVLACFFTQFRDGGEAKVGAKLAAGTVRIPKECGLAVARLGG